MIDIRRYELTLIGGDIQILGDGIHYATLCHGEMEGLQSVCMVGSPYYDKLLEKSRVIYNALLDIDFILRESRINNPV